MNTPERKSGGSLKPVGWAVPTITEMEEALSKAGWIRKHANIWQTPDGRLYRGPALAYHIMMGLTWPPPERPAQRPPGQRVMNTPETQSGGSLKPLVRKPRHKWFSTYDRECGDGWWGPHNTIEAAAMECVCQNGRESRIFIAHGHKLTEAERYSEFAWEVDAANAFEIILPNESGQARRENPKA